MSLVDDELVATVELPIGTEINNRWLIVDRLGEGCFGSVYEVKDMSTGINAALKVESTDFIGGTFLKQEVALLNRLKNQKFIPQLIGSGKREGFRFMVMTLFGENIDSLFDKCGRKFSLSTQIRLGIQFLNCLKQVHDVGFVHRDVKGSNFVIGKDGPNTRIVHLLDFGMAREFVSRNTDFVGIRRPRKTTLLRGTSRYCSANSHLKNEQGRVDDIWSMIYLLVEMRNGSLPWSDFNDEPSISRMKQSISDEELLFQCPTEMTSIIEHLKTLDYYKRPDYQLIFEVFCRILNKHNIKCSDRYDWETLHLLDNDSATNKPSQMDLNNNSHVCDEKQHCLLRMTDFNHNALGF